MMLGVLTCEPPQGTGYASYQPLYDPDGVWFAWSSGLVRNRRVMRRSVAIREFRSFLLLVRARQLSGKWLIGSQRLWWSSTKFARERLKGAQIIHRSNKTALPTIPKVFVLHGMEDSLSLGMEMMKQSVVESPSPML